jgi:hypothetical protein
MPRTWMVGIVGAALLLLAVRPRRTSGPATSSQAGPSAQAAHYVHFSVREPHFVSRPALIQVDDPAQVPIDEHAVAFVDHLPAAGTVLIEERRRGGSNHPGSSVGAVASAVSETEQADCRHENPPPPPRSPPAPPSPAFASRPT